MGPEVPGHTRRDSCESREGRAYVIGEPVLPPGHEGYSMYDVFGMDLRRREQRHGFPVEPVVRPILWVVWPMPSWTSRLLGS